MLKRHVFSALILCSCSVVSAQVPPLMSYQGRVTINATNFTGVGQFKFALVSTNALGATVTQWSSDGTSVSGGEPNTAVSVPVEAGLYAVLLGDATLTNMQGIPPTVFTNSDVRLRIWFSDGASNFEQLQPDQRIAAVGYAMIAGTAATATAFTGAIADTQLPAGIPRLNGNQTFTGLNGFAGIVNATNSANQFVGSFIGNGAGLTNLNAGLGNGLDPSGLWMLGGNAGTTPDTQFLGTTDGRALRLQAGGVGINTANPDRPLAIQGTGASTEWLSFKDTSGVTRWHLNSYLGGFNFVQSGVAEARLFLAPNGGLGVGVASPLHTVHVGSTLGVGAINSAGKKVVVEDASVNGRAVLLALAGPGGTNDAHRVELQIEASDGEDRAIIGTASNHEVQLRVNNAALITLATNGNVGIGTQTPTAKLEVSGTVAADAWRLNSAPLLGSVMTASDPSGNAGWQGLLRVFPAFSSSGLLIMQSANLVAGAPVNIVSNGVIGATVSGGGFYNPLVSAPNIAGGNYATVPGGVNNWALGAYSFAAGRRAKALHSGSFVWADAQDADFASMANNEFAIRAAGGLRLAGGNLGVGVTSVLHTVHAGGTLGVAAINNAGKKIVVEDASVNGRAVLLALAGSGGSTDAHRVELQLEASDGENRAIIGTASNHEVQLRVNNSALITLSPNGSVGIGTQSPADGILDVEGDTHINDHDVFLRGGSDRNHGLGWYGDTKPFAGENVDGPVLYGWSGGALGSTDGGQKVALKWNQSGAVSVKVLEITGGADVAEPFPMRDEEAGPGSVVVIDEEHAGQLKLSTRAYDTRVAGVVSGANGVKPGLALRQEGVLEGGRNVALTGRVYVNVDAAFGAIQPGDLLTTSDTPGHAMKAADRERRSGAILGKAMTALKTGRGMVLVLVSLQ